MVIREDYEREAQRLGVQPKVGFIPRKSEFGVRVEKENGETVLLIADLRVRFALAMWLNFLIAFFLAAATSYSSQGDLPLWNQVYAWGSFLLALLVTAAMVRERRARTYR